MNCVRLVEPERGNLIKSSLLTKSCVSHPEATDGADASRGLVCQRIGVWLSADHIEYCVCVSLQIGIDPPAGSPTGTLLRLLPGSNRRDQASSSTADTRPVANSLDFSKRFSPG